MRQRHAWIAPLALLGLTPWFALQAQQPAAPAASTAVSPSYVVGADDVLSLQVYGDPELNSPQMRVDSDGTIHIPYGKTPVKVLGLRVDQIQEVVAKALVDDGLTTANPRVDMSVVDVESKPIMISGAVRAAGQIQAVQPIRLLTALDRMGGIEDVTNSDIAIFVHNADGTERKTQTISANQLIRGNDPELNVLLYGGEELRVIPGGRYYVTGAVVGGGAFPLNDADPQTIRKAIAQAKNLQTTAKPKGATLVHGVGTGHEVTVPINIQAILDGKAPDISLAANDMINVPYSGAKKFTNTVLESSRTVLTSAAAFLIVQ